MTSPQPVQFGCVAVDPSGEVVAAGTVDTFQVRNPGLAGAGALACLLPPLQHQRQHASRSSVQAGESGGFVVKG